MNNLVETSLLVKCPHCGNKFNPEDALGHQIREQLEKEFDAKLATNARLVAENIRKEELGKYKIQLKALEEEKRTRDAQLRELQVMTVEMSRKEMEMKSREENLELEMKKRLVEREKLIKDQIESTAMQKAALVFHEKEMTLHREREALALSMQKRVNEETERIREEERLRQAELQKKLDDQHKLINEMKRKSEQGSMQLQGEVQELAIEEFLSCAFPRDVVEEVSKGKRGGDCVHVVRDQYNRSCGKILYESKRTKHFSNDWISKLKEDMRARQIDIGVIVTDAFPEGMTRFGERDGVWICTFPEFKALAHLFRFNMLRMGELFAAQENKGDKMNLIYSYITGNEFRQKLEAAFESYNEMLEDLMKEKSLFMSQWAKREKKLMKAMENLVCLYGDVRGIAGGAVQEIKCLEMPDLHLIED